jgi:putative cell wall-binding protein
MRRTLQILLLALFALTSVTVLAAEQKTTKKQRKELEETQVKYDSTLRWGTVEDALPYLDPEYAKLHPMTDLELRRFEQVKISSYRAGDNVPMPDGRVGRNAEARVINLNTQSERAVRVKEIWRWDAQGKRWLQANGLPDLWQDQDR